MKKNIHWLTAAALMSLALTSVSYADVISDAPIEIGSAPLLTEESTAAAAAESISAPENASSDMIGEAAAPAGAEAASGVIEIQGPAEIGTDAGTAAPASSAAPAASDAPAAFDAPTASDAPAAPAAPASASSAAAPAAPVQYTTVGGMVSGSLTGPAVLSSGSAGSSAGPSAQMSSGGGIGSLHANDPKVTVDLGYLLVSPNVDYNGYKVAEGSAQLADGSWETVARTDFVRNRYFKLISEQTDTTGTGWYVAAAGGRQVGSYRTSDGSILSEIWLRKSDCTVTGSIELNTSNTTRQQIVRNALALLGKRYQYAGNGPDAFDCSGFVHYVMDSVGISVPRTSSEICGCGTQVGVEGLRPGDIVGRSGHVGIYIADGWFIHASESSTGVIMESIEIYNRGNRFTNFVNVVGD